MKVEEEGARRREAPWVGTAGRSQAGLTCSSSVTMSGHLEWAVLASGL